jgi:hypothetical protein
MIYRIYDPKSITFSYFDDYGEAYAVPPEGADVEERPFTETEAMDALRSVRNTKLVDCDYTQLPDVGLDAVTVEAWRVYRQQLRDITDGLVWNVTTWPAKPV